MTTKTLNLGVPQSRDRAAAGEGGGADSDPLFNLTILTKCQGERNRALFDTALPPGALEWPHISMKPGTAGEE